VTLIYLAIAWMLGIIAADLLPLSPVVFQAATALGALLAALSWRRPRLRLIGLLLCCAALGGWRYGAAQRPPTAQDVRLLRGRGALTLDGFVQGDPKRTDDGQQVILADQAAQIGAQRRRADGIVLLNLPPYPEYRYGQHLVALGELETPRTATRPGEFDYRAYLARKGIFVLMREPLVRVRPGESSNPALRALLAFRDRCKAVLLRELPEPQASIAVGVLLGLQSSIPDETYNTFSVTGTSHILVVSGWNFTIVATVLAGLASRLRLKRNTIFWISMLVLWSYAFFVGPTGTVLRAAVMASLVVLARSIDRRTEPWTLLFAACWALTLYDPNTLWDLGFQLSALATASLFAFGRPVEAWLRRCPPLRWASLEWATEALTATLAAQILALPIILYQFGNLSLIAPLANILLVPVVPYTMLLGTLALVGGLIWLPLGQGLALIVWLPLSWLTEGARLLAQVPMAAIQLPPFPLWLLLGYYAIVVCGWLWNAHLVAAGAR
jgi:competence protein ComEC